jgi:mycothiol synthase
MGSIPRQVLNQGYELRAATLEDVEAIVDLYNAYWEPMLGVRKVTLEDARNIFTTPGFDIDTSTRIVLEPEGEMAGCMIVVDLASPPVHPTVFGCVHREYERRGIGTELITWAEERARKAISRVPDGVRVSMRLDSGASHEPTRRLVERLGFEAARFGLFMAIELTTAPPEPRWPAGITLRTYQDLADVRALYHALDEAFKDSWGYVERPEDEGLARFEHRVIQDPAFDPTLWYLAMDGEEIAGVAGCDPQTGEDTEMSFVSILGVRRPWRRRGIGLALLHHAFGEFRRRGKKRVGLGVDAESLTGATRLYERAGMHVVRQIVTYEKELRPGEELGRESL